MRKRVFRIRRNKKKTLAFLIITAIIFILLGVLVIAVLSKSNKILLKDYIEGFFLQIKSGKFNYGNSLKTVFFKNTISMFLIWLLGISLVGVPIIVVYFAFKALTMGMSIASIIYFYHTKGIFLGIIYIVPSIINIGIFLILVYNSLKMSRYLYHILFLHEETNKRIIRRYVNVLLILLVFMVISTLIEVLVVPSIMKLLL